MAKHLRKQQERLANRQAVFLNRLKESQSATAKPPMEGHVRNQFAQGGMHKPGSMNPKKGWHKK
jgi:hypothetical protein